MEETYWEYISESNNSSEECSEIENINETEKSEPFTEFDQIKAKLLKMFNPNLRNEWPEGFFKNYQNTDEIFTKSVLFFGHRGMGKNRMVNLLAEHLEYQILRIPAHATYENIRKIFEQAEKIKDGCIIHLIDMDTVAPCRGKIKLDSTYEIFNQMDKIRRSNPKAIVIGATTLPWSK